MSATGLSCLRTQKSRRGRPLGPTAQAIRTAVGLLEDRFDRMTVRQVFYQLEAGGVVEKTQAGYRQVQAQVLKMRREGLLDWDFITDGTRWQRKPQSQRSATDFIEQVARSYRRDLWQSQNVRVEVWLEKDALADVIYDVTHRWDVSLMVSRGQSSATFLHAAAKAAQQAWEEDDTETVIYTMYDYDAGGVRAARTIARELPTLAPGTPIEVWRLAVTEQQIANWRLPTRPATKTDPEAAKFGDRAVELDAIDPSQLRQLVEDAIAAHVDPWRWEVEQRVEAEERAGLLALSSEWGQR